MPESAFGIDHGEISKVKLNVNATSAGRAAGRAVRGTKKGAKAVVNTRVSLADVGRGVGSGAQRTGNFTNKILTTYPGASGAVLVGGAGYGGYRLTRRPDKSKKA